MFGKLLKYEMRSYSKTFLPLWGAIVALGLLNGLTLPANGSELETFSRIFSFSLPLFLFISCLIAAAVVALVLVVQRFYKGLLGAEGYLMFTLPVNVGELIGSKLLAAVLVQIITALVAALAFGGMFLLYDFHSAVQGLGIFFRAVGEFFRESPAEGWVIVLCCFELLVLSLLTSAQQTLHLYAAMSLGHLARKRRIAVSVLAYIGISTVMSNISVRVISASVQDRLPEWLEDLAAALFEHADSIAFLPGLLGGCILLMLIPCAALWAVSHLVLKKRLNLE